MLPLQALSVNLPSCQSQLLAAQYPKQARCFDIFSNDAT